MLSWPAPRLSGDNPIQARRDGLQHLTKMRPLCPKTWFENRELPGVIHADRQADDEHLYIYIYIYIYIKTPNLVWDPGFATTPNLVRDPGTRTPRTPLAGLGAPRPCQLAPPGGTPPPRRGTRPRSGRAPQSTRFFGICIRFRLDMRFRRPPSPPGMLRDVRFRDLRRPPETFLSRSITQSNPG